MGDNWFILSIISEKASDVAVWIPPEVSSEEVLWCCPVGKMQGIVFLNSIFWLGNSTFRLEFCWEETWGKKYCCLDCCWMCRIKHLCFIIHCDSLTVCSCSICRVTLVVMASLEPKDQWYVHELVKDCKSLLFVIHCEWAFFYIYIWFIWALFLF